MKTSKVLIGTGIGIFILPFVLGLYHMWIENWNLLDWLILYSFVYWPTYVFGAVLIVGGWMIYKKQIQL
ncbi:MAG: hypothetical protein E7192_06955 [Erysipelotrichaceae bacterium]|nr:hypothetical protein [Erysipelotrichaceae bacterium]